jgi:phosphate-selective porin
MKALIKSLLIVFAALSVLRISTASSQESSPVAGKLDSLELRIRALEAIKTRAAVPPQKEQSHQARLSAEDSIAESTIADLQRRIERLAEKLGQPGNVGMEPESQLLSYAGTPIRLSTVPESGSPSRGSDVASVASAHPAAVQSETRTEDPPTMKMVSSVAPVPSATPTPATQLAVAPESGSQPRAIGGAATAPASVAAPTVAVVSSSPAGQPVVSAAPPAAAAPKPGNSAGITLKPGRGFTIESPDNTFSLQPGGRIQFRHSLTTYDRDRSKDDLSNFSVERFEIWLSGKAFAEWNYKFEGNFGKGNVKLGDGFVEWGRYDAIRPKMGQFKVTFDRQMRTSSSEQSFVDRSTTAKTFGLERDIGLMLSGATADKKFQYNAGIFNGEGENKANTGAGELAVVRISANPNGDFGFSESDPKGTTKYLWIADAAVAYNASSAYKDWNNDGTIGGHDDEANVFRFVAGLGFRHAGLFAQGEYYGQNERPKMAALKNVRANGWYGQLGYMIVPSSWELAGRYSVVDPDAAKSDNTKREAAIGINHFLLNTGHAMKMTADVTLRIEEKGPTVRYSDVEVRTQLQLTY